MNKSFQSYTPRVRAISYDALTLDTGCQIASGTKVLQLQPIIEICITKHNPESAIYNQLETVNYFLGPDSIGSSAKPFTDSWAVWVATAGIRIGKFTTITPPSDSQGAAAPFYATMTPPHLSGAFNQDGFLAIAIQKTDATIEITHGESQGVASFIGQSPQLINDGILYASDTPGRSQVACIYVRGDRNDMLFARFENENFATEYIIVRATRSNIVKLLSITISALHFTIHGIDYLGRDVKMTSDDYFVELLGEKVSLSTSILSGKLAELGVVVDAGHDASKVTLALKDGTNFLAARVPPTTTDNITLSIGIESGTLT